MPRRTDLNEELQRLKARLEAEADRLHRENLTAVREVFAARLPAPVLHPRQGAW